MKPIGRGELMFKEFILEVVEGGFWQTKGTFGGFKESSISLEDHAILFLASQIHRYQRNIPLSI